MPTVKLCSLSLGSGLLLFAGMTQAAAPSIADTSWDLTGKLSGKASVSCKFGGSSSRPIKAPSTVLNGRIDFDDGDVTDDGEGTFTWQDNSFSNMSVPVTGTWKQTGAKFTLNFENWYDSPMAAFGFDSQPAFQSFFSQDSINGVVNGLEPTKTTFSGTINARGSLLTISESMGFKFNASAFVPLSNNSCSYILNIGRKFTGKQPPLQ